MPRGTIDAIQCAGESWKNRLGLARQPFEVVRIGQGFSLRAAGVTGVVEVDGLTIEVIPKFLDGADVCRWKQALWNVLVHVGGEPLTAPARVLLSEERNPADLLARSLLRGLSEAWLDGLPRAYEEQEAALPFLRGRIVPARAAELVWRPDTILCRYDAFIEDNSMNRLLRWAVRTLAPMVRNSRLARELDTADERFAEIGVGLQPPSLVEAERLRLSPQHQHLSDALEVAKLVLSERSIEHGHGAVVGIGFLWRSAEVFERFVKLLLVRACTGTGREMVDDAVPVATLQTTAAAQRILWTYPDARIQSGGRTVAILDAKYKHWKNRRPAPADTYQVIAAGWLEQCDPIGLIYPAPGGRPRAPVVWRLLGPNAPRRLCAMFVDITRMGESGGEDELVAKLAADLSLVLQP